MRHPKYIYREWFDNFRFPNHENTEFNYDNKLPKGWQLVELGQLVTLRQGFALNKKSGHHISDIVTEYPLLKISDLFNDTETLFVKETIPKQFLVDKDEIIFSRTGQVGHAFMGRKGVLYNNCFRVTPNEKIDLYFLFSALLSPSFVSSAKSLATGVAQPDLNHDAFKSIKIILPSIDFQKKFSIMFQENLKLKYVLKKQNKLLSEARNTLLPRLMNRTIEV
jgi:type I restriction enzyme S subunit